MSVAFVMTLSVVVLNACGSIDSAEQSGADEPVATTEAAIIPGSAVTQVIQSVVIPANETRIAGPSCPSGSVVVGGGHFAGGAARVYVSQKLGNRWVIHVLNLSASSIGIDVYAQCLSGTNATSDVVWNSAPISAGAVGSLSVTCPTGKILSGGGYYGDSLAIDPFRNYPSSTTTWSAAVKNRNSVAADSWHVQGVCLSGVTGATTLQSTQANIPAGGQVKFSSNPCASDKLLSSGGYHNSTLSPNIIAVGNLRNFQNPLLWTAVVKNTTTGSITATLKSACLELWP